MESCFVIKRNELLIHTTTCGCGLVAKLCPTLVNPWTVAGQAPLSMGFSRKEYWSVLPFPSPGDLLNPGIEPGSPALQADSFFFFFLIEVKSWFYFDIY